MIVICPACTLEFEGEAADAFCCPECAMPFELVDGEALTYFEVLDRLDPQAPLTLGVVAPDGTISRRNDPGTSERVIILGGPEGATRFPDDDMGIFELVVPTGTKRLMFMHLDPGQPEAGANGHYVRLELNVPSFIWIERPSQELARVAEFMAGLPTSD